MNQNSLASFLQWFCQQEFIPLQTRHDLVKHLRNEKKLDDKTLNFINQVMTQQAALVMESEKAHQALQMTLDELIADKSQIDESLENSALEQIQTLRDNYVKGVQSFNQTVSLNAEGREHLEEIDTVNQLKAAL